MKGDLPVQVQEVIEQQQEEEEKLNHEESQKVQNNNEGNQSLAGNNPAANDDGDHKEQQGDVDGVKLKKIHRGLSALSKEHQKLVDEIKKKEKLLKKYQDIYD